MDRNILCSKLKSLRQEYKVPMKSICSAMDVMPTAVYRLEKGANNFNLQLLLNYLNAIGAELVLTRDKSKVIITNYETFIDWLIKARTPDYTQRTLAEKTGITHVTISNIESQKNIITIDYFFKIAEALGYVIGIKKKV